MPIGNYETVGAGYMMGPLIKAAITAANTPIGRRAIKTGIALGTRAVLRKDNGPPGPKPVPPGGGGADVPSSTSKTT